MANNGPTYTRLGPGDLPGNPNHPGSPDYVEPAFGPDDAASNVANRMVADGEVGLLIESLSEGAGVLGWIASNVELPWQLRTSFRELLEHAERTRRAVDAELEALNASEAAA